VGSQHADLASEVGRVVVDGAVLDEAIRNLHHVNAAEFYAAPGR
jgi:hypothetical protein